MELVSCLRMLCLALPNSPLSVFFFFFQAEDGIRDVAVTGVQTCALPIYLVPARQRAQRAGGPAGLPAAGGRADLGDRGGGPSGRSVLGGGRDVRRAAGGDRKSVV